MASDTNLLTLKLNYVNLCGILSQTRKSCLDVIPAKAGFSLKLSDNMDARLKHSGMTNLHKRFNEHVQDYQA